MIYLLSFDKSVVIRALEDVQKCSGEEYLEKIIQVPFDVPIAKLSLVHNVFIEKVNRVFNDIPYENFEREYWNYIFTDCISQFFNSIRDANWILNVYRFKYGLMHNETNFMDLLAITTLQVCETNIYNWIYENINSLIGSLQSAGGITGIDQKKIRNEYLTEFKTVYPDNPELMISEFRYYVLNFHGGLAVIHIIMITEPDEGISKIPA
jgi:predicted KAP-like P-loop ATPase